MKKLTQMEKVFIRQALKDYKERVEKSIKAEEETGRVPILSFSYIETVLSDIDKKLELNKK